MATSISLLLLVVVAVLFALVASLPNAESEKAYDDAFLYPRLRRDPVAFHGENAYLQQLLSNLKPRFRRGGF